MTIDEAIKICEEDAERIGGNPQSDCHAECCRQFAEWFMELKDLREENKVLTSECDRLIKEKEELLSKVSDGEICQLEEQIKDWKEEYAYINKLSYGYYKELKEAKQLLKAAVEDLNVGHCIKNCETCMNKSGSYCVCYGNYKWRYTNEAMKLIGDESSV